MFHARPKVFVGVTLFVTDIEWHMKDGEQNGTWDEVSRDVA